MRPFFDLHSHMLCHVDDGAKDREVMFAMLEMAYADGIRALCLTPHYSPYLFGDTFESSKEAFEVLSCYVEQKHPDMQLFLGHELGYHNGCLAALNQGICRTINNSRYVLVDFPENANFFELSTAVNQLRGVGFRPILAHTERYRCLHSKLDWIGDFIEEGGTVQVNASSATGGWGMLAKMQWKKLIKEELVHIVSSDAHNLTTRPPIMSGCINTLEKYCDPETVVDLTWNNAWRVVKDQNI